MFESSDPGSREASGGQNKTDSRFFWLALYVQPALWCGLAVMALVTLKFVWLSLVGEFLLEVFLSFFDGSWEERKGRKMWKKDEGENQW